MSEAYLVGGVRTPVGRYGGALAGVRPDDLAALVVGEALARASVPRDAIDEVILGAANQAGEDNRNVARMAVLLAGLPDEIPGLTVNRLCASGMSAIALAAQAVRAGDADVRLSPRPSKPLPCRSAPERLRSCRCGCSRWTSAPRP